jgi:hypothetical protein
MLENLLQYYRKSDGATKKRGRNGEGERGRKKKCECLFQYPERTKVATG